MKTRGVHGVTPLQSQLRYFNSGMRANASGGQRSIVISLSSSCSRSKFAKIGGETPNAQRDEVSTTAGVGVGGGGRRQWAEK